MTKIAPTPDGGTAGAGFTWQETSMLGNVRAQVNTDSIRAAAGRLNAASLQLGDLSAQASGLGMSQWFYAIEPGHTSDARGQSSALTSKINEASQHAAKISRHLTGSADDYDSAEDRVNGLFRMLHISNNPAIAFGKVAGDVLAAKLKSKMDGSSVITDYVHGDPQSVSNLANLIDSLMPGDFSQDEIWIGLAGSIDLTDSPVTTRLVQGPGADQTPAVDDLGSGLGRIVNLYSGSTNEAHIDIQRVVDPATGQGAWTVMLPGTSNWAPNARTPLDLTGNLKAVTGNVTAGERAATDALRTAMKDAGVLDKHEPVMIMGHSQGGMIAVNMAQHSQENHEFNVTHVVTCGSPVEQFPPHGYQQMNIHMKNDPVWQLDGGHLNSDDPYVTRVDIQDKRALSDVDGTEKLAAAHDVGYYAADFSTLARLSKPGTPVGSFAAGSKQFFRGKAQTYSFTSWRPSSTPSDDSGDSPKYRAGVHKQAHAGRAQAR